MCDKIAKTEQFPEGLALDLGAGTGTPTKVLRTVRQGPVVGLDISAGMLRRGTENFLDGAATATQADAHHLPFPTASLSLVTAFSAFHLFEDRGRVLDEVARVLLPGGHLVLAYVDAEDLEMQLFHKVFPGFAGVERARHVVSAVVDEMASIRGMQIISRAPYEFTLRLKDVDAAIALLGTRPFFGLQQMEPEAFAAGLQEVQNQLRRRFPVGPIYSPYVLTMAIYMKHDA